MSSITYDYHALKDAHGKLTAAVENFEAIAKNLSQAGHELIEGNNAEGVKSTMTSFDEKQTAVVKAMQALLEQTGAALKNARELHLANGGEE